ncbi:MAG: NAD-dependent epimerase/dehydratase family protein [Blastocatellia bacterium]
MDQFWKDRPVLITGASGFVAAHIARRLLDRGALVQCLLRNPEEPGALALLDLHHRVRIVEGHVEDLPRLQNLLNEHRIDAVFHLAAQSIVGVASASPLATFEANIRGTYRLLEACRCTASVRRIVVASSEKAYGSPRDPLSTEQHPLAGLSPYDASKACADIICRSFAYSCQLPVAVVRSANIYGPGDLNLSRIVPGAIDSLLRHQPPVIRGDGTPVREFIHVDDVARGYILLAEQIGESRGEAFNIGAGSPISIIDLVNLLIRIAGLEGQIRPAILQPPGRPSRTDLLSISSELIRHRLGWKPLIALDDGLHLTFEWYRQHQHLLPGNHPRH